MKILGSLLVVLLLCACEDSNRSKSNRKQSKESNDKLIEKDLETREWQLKSGKKVKAKYSRIDKDYVYLIREDKTVRIKLVNLSQKDLDYLKQFDENYGSDEVEDKIQTFSSGDPQMNNAIKKDRDNYHVYKTAVIADSKKVVPGISAGLLKYGFKTDPGSKVEVEHMYISQLHYDGKNIKGTLTNDPYYCSKLKNGMTVVVKDSQVTDWVFLKDGKAYGGYTFKLMWSRFSQKDKALYGKHPPFSWLGLK